VFTILCLPFCVYHFVFTILCLPFCVYHFVFTILCLPFCVYHFVFTILCLPFCVYHFVFTILCLPLCVYHFVFTIFYIYKYNLTMCLTLNDISSSNVKPSLCMIFICLTRVLFPLSAAPVNTHKQ